MVLRPGGLSYGPAPVTPSAPAIPEVNGVNPQTEAILQTIRTLPAHSVIATLRNPRGSSTRTFKGALLYDYARAMGLTPVPPSVGFGNYYFVVTAEDGFKVALAYFEVTPRATEKQVLLAYEQDGEPLNVGVRLVVPGDDLGGRSITSVVSIELRHVESAEPQPTRPRAETLTLDGLLERPVTLNPEDFDRFEKTEITTQPTPRHGGVTVPSRRYRGVLLWDLLESAGPRLDAAINEDILRKVVIARSTDGYAAVIAAGEIEPRFMAGQILVATECDGEPLREDEGRYRLIVPFDRVVGRMPKGVSSIELLEA